MTAAGVALAGPAAARRRSPAGLRALARIEGRRLLRNPAFLVGVALSLLFLRDAGDGATLQAFQDGFALLPVAAGTLVAANLAALRSRRSGTDELYGSLPRPRSMRVSGQLLALLWTLPVTAALIAIAHVADSFDDYTRTFSPGIVQIAQGPTMVIAFGAIGILLARLAPSAIAGSIAVVGLLAARAFTTPPDGWLAWALPLSGGTALAGPGVPCEPAISTGPDCMMFVNHLGSGMHLAYLAGVALLAGAAALGAGRRRLAAIGLLAAALAVTTKLAGG